MQDPLRLGSLRFMLPRQWLAFTAIAPRRQIEAAAMQQQEITTATMKQVRILKPALQILRTTPTTTVDTVLILNTPQATTA